MTGKDKYGYKLFFENGHQIIQNNLFTDIGHIEIKDASALVANNVFES